MKQTEGPLSEGYVRIMPKKLRDFHFLECIFAVDVLYARFVYRRFNLGCHLRKLLGLGFGLGGFG